LVSDLRRRFPPGDPGLPPKSIEVPWPLRIAIVYVTLMIALVAACEQMAHLARYRTFELRSDDGRYRLVGYREFPLPRILGGGGPAPGEAQVVDPRGRVLDSAHFEDLTSIYGVQWSRFKVGFLYEQDGRTYRTSLDLAQ
jgi:hypothetical protein